MQTRWDFGGRVVVITGGAGGIGASVARLFHAAGASVVLADRDRAALDAVAASLPDADRVMQVALDAASPASIDDLVDQVRRRFGHIDHLIPCAGVYPASSVAATTDDLWRTVMSINLDGVFLLIRRSLPLIREGGSIVTITSVAGHRGSRDHGHYAASKAGLLALTRTLAIELGPAVRVNAVSPGTILTSMVDELIESRGDDLIANTPLGRNGKPDEVAAAIAFLASDAASYIQGEVLHVNGGLFMAG